MNLQRPSLKLLSVFLIFTFILSQIPELYASIPRRTRLLPAGQGTSYQYDNNGNMISKTDSEGRCRSMSEKKVCGWISLHE